MTDPTVATVAYHQALSRLASAIGISITSGGMGKTELSTNETQNNAVGARSLAAWRIIQS
jgi:hypothetical protein